MQRFVKLKKILKKASGKVILRVITSDNIKLFWGLGFIPVYLKRQVGEVWWKAGIRDTKFEMDELHDLGPIILRIGLGT